MKILVTGSNGQLGSELKATAVLESQHSFDFVDIGEMDLANAIQNFFRTSITPMRALFPGVTLLTLSLIVIL